MKLHINIPNKKYILKKGLTVSIASRGHRWSEDCVHPFTKDRGVYVIHYDGRIKYVGKTAGKSMSFGMRLRRHFQESAAGKHTYPRLRKLKVPPNIFVYFFSSKEILKLVNPIRVYNEIRLIELFEAALILEWNPDFQKEERVYIKK